MYLYHSGLEPTSFETGSAILSRSQSHILNPEAEPETEQHSFPGSKTCTNSELDPHSYSGVHKKVTLSATIRNVFLANFPPFELANTFESAKKHSVLYTRTTLPKNLVYSLFPIRLRLLILVHFFT